MNKDVMRTIAFAAIAAAALWGANKFKKQPDAPPTPPQPPQPGEVSVMGGVGSVRVATHGKTKTPGDDTTISIDYSTTALKNSAAVPWNYRLRVQMIHSDPNLASSNFIAAAPELPNVLNGPKSAVVTLKTPAALGFYGVYVSLDAAVSVNGLPSAQWTPIGTMSHLNAVENISAEIFAQGSVTGVAVSQRIVDRLGI